MRGELKKYQLRATRKPAKKTVLSSTVIVRNEAGQYGYCYVNFDESLEDRVGHALPHGIGPDHPANLQVLFYPRNEKWLVMAQYVGQDDSAVLLWSTDTRPGWLNFHTGARQ